MPSPVGPGQMEEDPVAIPVATTMSSIVTRREEILAMVINNEVVDGDTIR